MTRNGEARIRNCVKFDLVGGYRLVCRKEPNRLVMVYAGAHDACDRWIINNRVRQPDTEGDFLAVAAPRKGGTSSEGRAIARPGAPEGDAEVIVDHPQEDYDDILMRRVGDRELRAIFGGLCR